MSWRRSSGWLPLKARPNRIAPLSGDLANLDATAQAELVRSGEASPAEPPDGPFRGVPFVLNDLGAAFAGQPLHMGTHLLKDANFHSPVDTYLAQRFRAAGFVTIGKTNTPELGILPTTEPRAHGPSRNPWDLERSTGGSSGGSAAATAAGIVPVAHANDGGGSIRSVQLVGDLGREDLLIRVATQLEQAQPWADRRPPLFAAAVS